MSLEQGFLRAILENPEDDSHRLIYADWLEERDDPRGDFIRVQCARGSLPLEDSRQPQLRQRERELLAAHEEVWVAPLRPWVREWQFHRGFVEWVRIPAEYMRGAGKQVFSRTPIRHVRFNEATKHIAALAKMPELGRLQSLDLGYNLLAASHVSTLVASTHLQKLRRLDLACNPLRDAGFQALAEKPFRQLSELCIYRTGLGTAGLRALLEAQSWPAFTSLDLHNNGNLDTLGAEALAHSPRSVELRQLNLTSTQIGKDGVAALAGSAYFGNLRHLDLSLCRLDDDAAYALTQPHTFQNLEELNLFGNEIGDAGAQALLHAVTVGRLNLKRLGLAGNSRIHRADVKRALRQRFGDAVVTN